MQYLAFDLSETSTPLHPPAKLCYVLIALGQSAKVPKSTILLVLLHDTNTSSVNFSVSLPTA